MRARSNGVRPSWLLLRLLGVALCGLAACGNRDVVGLRSPAGDGALGDGGGGTCAAGGPPVRVLGEAVCAGDLASQAFRYALCACAGLSLQTLRTDSFHSGQSPSVGSAGAAVGVNRDYTTTGKVDIGGFLIVGTDLSCRGEHVVGGDLKVGGSLLISSRAQVRRDAWVDGDIIAPGSSGAFTVGRDLYQSPQGYRTGGISVTGASQTKSFTVPPPCDCSKERRIDIAAIVEEGSFKNDNAAISLDPGGLARPSGGRVLDLPCGRYFVESIGGAVTLRLTGRTALFVRGDMLVESGFALELGPDAELDLFIGGMLSLGGGVKLGEGARPAATRLYVAGTVVWGAGSVLAGNLYAPQATLTGQGALEVSGAILVNGLAGASLTVHYDRAIFDVGCPSSGGLPGASCSTRSCSSLAECCEPLQCWEGRCLPVVD